jgi:hypothetical protein
MADEEEPASTDKEILEEARERLRLCIDDNDEQRKLQLLDLKFATLDQWPAEIRASREDPSQPGGPRPCLTLDKINQYVTQVVNDMRQNRPAIKVRPIDDYSDVETAAVFQDLARHVEDKSNANIAYDNAGQSAVITGEGYFRLVTEYEDEKSDKQKIVIKPCPDMFSVYLGPHLMPDGSDAEYGFILEDIPEDRFKREFSDAKYQPQYFPEEGSPNWRSEGAVRVAEYFYFDYKDALVLFLADENATAMMEDEYNAIPEAQRPPVQDQRETKIKSVKWCKLTGAEILEKRDWAGKFIPIVKVTGRESWVEGKRRIWGLVRPAIDALRAYNYWFSAITERLALSPKTPIIGAVGQFATDANKWDNANTTNYPYLQYDAIEVNGAQVPPPGRQAPAQLESAMIQHLQILEHDVQTALGMYKASLGQEQPQQSGKAILALTRESDTGTFHFPNNLANSVRYCGRIIVDLSPKIYDTAQILRLKGEDGMVRQAQIDPSQQQAMRQVQDAAGNIKRIYNLGVGEYDVTTTVGPSYNTKRMESSAIFTDLANSAKDPASAAVMRYLAIKASDSTATDEAVKMLKPLLPPQVLAAVDGQPQIPPQVQAHVQQLETALKAAAQKIQELAGGEQQAQAKIAAARSETEAALKLKRDIAISEEEDRRLKAQNDAAFDQWKAELDAATKVTVAQIVAKAGTTQTLIEAEAKANLELSGALNGSPEEAMAQGETAQAPPSPVQRLADMHAQHMDAIGKLVPAISSGMDALNQKIDASKPVSIESVKDKSGKITHGIATYANGDKRTITVN